MQPVCPCLHLTSVPKQQQPTHQRAPLVGLGCLKVPSGLPNTWAAPPEGCLRPHTRSPFKNQCAGLTKLVRQIFSKVRPPVRAFVSPPTAFLPRFCSSECKSSELCLRICAMSSSIFSIQRRFAIYEFFFRRFFSKNSADEG